MSTHTSTPSNLCMGTQGIETPVTWFPIWHDQRMIRLLQQCSTDDKVVMSQWWVSFISYSWPIMPKWTASMTILWNFQLTSHGIILLVSNQIYLHLFPFNCNCYHLLTPVLVTSWVTTSASEDFIWQTDHWLTGLTVN